MPRMNESAFVGKADIPDPLSNVPLLTQSRKSGLADPVGANVNRARFAGPHVRSDVRLWH
jgi:hypothetical protein